MVLLILHHASALSSCIFDTLHNLGGIDDADERDGNIYVRS